MNRTVSRAIILLYIILSLTACGTITSLAEKDYGVYAGVIKDFHLMQEGGVFSVLAVIDLPLSFVLDTLMLPVTLSQ